jgi:hypothetical protein
VARKYAYWISTALICLLYLVSATVYVAQGAYVREALGTLGDPAYLLPILIAIKVLAVAAILSRVSVALSDLAYAGMFYHLLLAFSAHVNAGDGGFAGALIGLCLLIVSFFTQNAARAKLSPYAAVPK